MRQQARAMFEEVRNLVLPPHCAGCGTVGRPLCHACRDAVDRPRARQVRGIQVVAASFYSGWPRKAILELKDGSADALAGLAEAIAEIVPTRAHCLVSIPSSAAKIALRGSDTISELARQSAASRGMQFVPALRMARATEDQVGLSATQRANNLRGAFASTYLVRGLVVVVDDVVTTGATIAEAARALRIAGAQAVMAVCVCSAQNPD